MGVPAPGLLVGPGGLRLREPHRGGYWAGVGPGVAGAGVAPPPGVAAGVGAPPPGSGAGVAAGRVPEPEVRGRRAGSTVRTGRGVSSGTQYP
ncbi:MAG TPA: hypothetical protein VM840_03345, partial [Actinomycetota bacterium]|nr:hypothetical protein [Actinomycetota bacterium]